MSLTQVIPVTNGAPKGKRAGGEKEKKPRGKVEGGDGWAVITLGRAEGKGEGEGEGEGQRRALQEEGLEACLGPKIGALKPLLACLPPPPLLV